MPESDHQSRSGGSESGNDHGRDTGWSFFDFLETGDDHPCPYLADRSAREEFFAARHFPEETYHDLMDRGFRRSGYVFYRPACDGCRECRPIRVPVAEYAANKSQRRIMRKNAELSVTLGPLRYSAEKRRLYARYLSAQHRSVGDGSTESLRSALYATPVATLEMEYRLNGKLVAVGIADVCSRSMSSVYAYYDPDCASRSLGTYSALREIHLCRELGIPHYYLGFHIRNCPSMSYKARFKPHEILDDSLRWSTPRTDHGVSSEGRVEDARAAD